MRENGRAATRWVSCSMALGAILVGCIVLPPEPKFTVSPESLAFVAAPADESVPEQILSVDDPEGLTGIITVTADEPWVTITPMARLAYVGAPWGFSIGVTLDGLAEDTHTATLTVRSELDGAEVLVPVTLTVSADALTAQGVLHRIENLPIPRSLAIPFVQGTPQEDAIAVVESFGATVTAGGGTPWCYGLSIELPIGTSLQEGIDHFSSEPLILGVTFNYDWGGITPQGTYATHRLRTETGGYLVYHETPGYLETLEREWIVEVGGILRPMHYGGSMGCPPHFIIYTVTVLGPNELTIPGTIMLAGPSGQYLLLIADSGDVWELTGTLADDIAALSDIDGAPLTVTGIDKGVSLDAHSGGLVLEVTSYALYRDPEEIRALIAEALRHVSYPDGSRITFLTTELGPGTLIEGALCFHPDGRPPFYDYSYTVERSGYLVFIDEQPLYDWEHGMQLIFVPRDTPGEPYVVDSGAGFPDWAITDPSGNRIYGTWEVFSAP